MDELVNWELEQRGEVVVAHVAGELDVSQAPRLGRGDRRRGAPTRPAALVVDFSKLEFIDSSGIAMLFSLARKLRSRRQQLRVVVPCRASRSRACWASSSSGGRPRCTPTSSRPSLSRRQRRSGPPRPTCFSERSALFITGALGFIGRRLCGALPGCRRRGGRGGPARRSSARRGAPATCRGRVDWQDARSGAELVIHTAALVVAAAVTRRLPGSRTWAARAMRSTPRRVPAGALRALLLDHGLRPRLPRRRGRALARSAHAACRYVDTQDRQRAGGAAGARRGELDCTIVRPGDVYGPGSPAWTVLPVKNIKSGLMRVPRGGRMSPVYVDNLVDGVMLAGAARRPRARCSRSATAPPSP